MKCATKSIYQYGEKKAVTSFDYCRIIDAIQREIQEQDVEPVILHHLYLSLFSSKMYFPESIPENVVTMNSEIIIGMNGQAQKKIKIVFPGEDTSPAKVSVFSPMGIACLGAREKSEISFFDNGWNHAYIEEIAFQPEKEKLFNI